MINVIRFKLSELLGKRGYDTKSYREIAKEAGIDHVSLWKMINGKTYNPSLDMFDRLCRYLKCQPGDILEYKKD